MQLGRVRLALLAVPSHERQQRVGIERLLEVARDTEARRLLADVARARADDDGDGRHPRIADLRGPELPTVHARHHEVEQDQAGRFGYLEPVERLAAVEGELHQIALRLQELPERIPELDVVLDDEDPVVMPGHYRSA